MTVDIAQAFPDYERHEMEDIGVFRFNNRERISLTPIRMDSDQVPGRDQYIFAAGHYWLSDDAQANQFHEWRYEFKVGVPGQPAAILALIIHENRRDVTIGSAAGVSLLKSPSESITPPKGRLPRQFRR